MPIVHFRVDQRLIHGQVAIAWSKITNPNHIIVANDEVANDKTQQAILKLAAPKQVRLSMVPVDKAIAYMNRGLQSNENVFLLVRDVIDANRFFAGGLQYAELNIGNMGHKKNSLALTKKLYALPEEIQSIKEMVEKQVYCYAQILPSDKKEDLGPIIKAI